MRRPRSIAFASSLLLALALCTPTPAQEPATDESDDARTGLTVTGEGKARATPDIAVVRLGAVAQAADAQRAQAQVDEAIRQTVEVVAELGVPRENIQTQQVMLWPVYSHEPPRPLTERGERDDDEPRIVGFRASSTLEIRVEDLAKTGQVLGAAVAAGANQLEGLTFELRDDAPQKAEALKEAVAAARNKAEAIAGALGMRLGEVVEAHEGAAQFEPLRFSTGRTMAAAAGSAAVPVQPGEVAVTASVTLRYRLLPGGE